jgi:hypothetical protein
MMKEMDEFFASENDAIVYAFPTGSSSSSFIVGDNNNTNNLSLSSLFGEEDEDFSDHNDVDWFQQANRTEYSSTTTLKEDLQLIESTTSRSPYCVKVTHWAQRVLFFPKRMKKPNVCASSSSSCRFWQLHPNIGKRPEKETTKEDHFHFREKVNQSYSATSVSTATTTTSTSVRTKQPSNHWIHWIDTSYEQDHPDDDFLLRAKNLDDSLAQELELAAHRDRERMTMPMAIANNNNHNPHHALVGLEDPKSIQPVETMDHTQKDDTRSNGNQHSSVSSTDDFEKDRNVSAGTFAAAPRVSSSPPPGRTAIKRVTWDPALFSTNNNNNNNNKETHPLVDLTNVQEIPLGEKETEFHNSSNNHNKTKEWDRGNPWQLDLDDATEPFPFDASGFPPSADPWQSSPEHVNGVAWNSSGSPIHTHPEEEMENCGQEQHRDASCNDDLEDDHDDNDNDPDDTASIVTASMIKELENATLYLQRYEKTKQQAQREKQKRVHVSNDSYSTMESPCIYLETAVNQHGTTPDEKIDSGECVSCNYTLDDSFSGSIPYIGSVSSVPSDMENEPDGFSTNDENDQDDTSQRLGICRYTVEKPKIVPLAWSREHRTPTSPPSDKVRPTSDVGPSCSSSIPTQVETVYNNDSNLLRQTASFPTPRNLHRPLPATNSKVSKLNGSLEMGKNHLGLANSLDNHQRSRSHNTDNNHVTDRKNVSQRRYSEKGNHSTTKVFHGSSNRPSSSITRLQMEPFIGPRRRVKNSGRTFQSFHSLFESKPPNPIVPPSETVSERRLRFLVTQDPDDSHPFLTR